MAAGCRGCQYGSHRSATIKLEALTAMPQFAVFFSEHAGFGIEMVQALVTSQNPTFTFTGAWGSMSTWIGLLSSTLTWIGWALRT